MNNPSLNESQVLDTIKTLLKNPESEIVEFKEKKNGFDKKELGEYFSALSNEACLRGLPDAWIVFGVDDHRNPVGTSVLPEEKDCMALRKEIADKTTNRITFRGIYPIEYLGKRIILFQIPTLPGCVVTYNGIAYGRDGESLVGLSLDKIDILRARNSDWSEELLSEDMSSLDPVAVSLAKELYMENNPRRADDVKNWSDEEFLSMLRLVRNDRITKAAALLLGKREMIIDLGEPEISWVVKSENGIVRDYRHLHIPFLNGIEEAISLITNRTFRRIMSGTGSQEMPTYAPDTLREALVNAVVHCDYRKGLRIEITEIQDECIIFTNPGSFTAGDPETTAQSARRSSIQRNPFLATILKDLGKVDSIGYGLQRMFISQMSRGFPLPEYELNDDFVSMTLTGHVINETVARVTYFNNNMTLSDYIILDKYQKMKELSSDDRMQYERIRRNLLYGGELPSLGNDLKEKEKMIWDLIKTSDGLSIQEISDALEMNYATARYNVKKLEDRGCIVKTKRGWVPIRYPSR